MHFSCKISKASSNVKTDFRKNVIVFQDILFDMKTGLKMKRIWEIEDLPATEIQRTAESWVIGIPGICYPGTIPS